MKDAEWSWGDYVPDLLREEETVQYENWNRLYSAFHNSLVIPPGFSWNVRKTRWWEKVFNVYNYYVELRDDTGKVVVRMGKMDARNQMTKILQRDIIEKMFESEKLSNFPD